MKIGYYLAVFLLSSAPLFAGPLDGVWEDSACLKSKTNKKYYERETVAFNSEAKWSTNVITYHSDDDDFCDTDPVFQIQYNSEFKAQDLNKNKKRSNINIRIQDITVKSDNEEFIKNLVKKKACGLKNWEAGIEKRVNARKCLNHNFLEDRTVVYGVYTINEDGELEISRNYAKKRKNRGNTKIQTFEKIQDKF